MMRLVESGRNVRVQKTWWRLVWMYIVRDGRHPYIFQGYGLFEMVLLVVCRNCRQVEDLHAWQDEDGGLQEIARDCCPLSKKVMSSTESIVQLGERTQKNKV